jgi:hypothetical protein
VNNAQAIAITRYYVILLARSQRWLPPVLCYAIALAIDSAGGDSSADAFAYSAAFLLPVTAWLTRAILTTEPDEAWSITATMTGPVRARLAALSAATGYGLLCAIVGGLVAIATGALAGGASTLVAGLCTELICVLLGTAAGVLSAPPLVPAAGWGMLLAALLSLALLVTRISPAAMGIRALTNVANGGQPHFPLLAVPFALVIVAAVWTATTSAASRH